MSDFETRAPTVNFRWYVDIGQSQPRLQQLFYGSRGEVWIDVPTVFDASVPLSGDAQFTRTPQ